MNSALREVVRDTYKMFAPPSRRTVSQWADERRILTSDASSEVGRWSTDRAPFQREIMDAFTQHGVWLIAIQASSQVGKTEMELNMLGRVIDEDPGSVLFVQPTLAIAEDFSKRRVASMIAACPTLRQKVCEVKSRDANNTILMKQFPGGNVTFTGANSPRELAGRPIRYLFMDEIDGFPRSAGTEGDPIKLAERRTETFRHNRKVVVASTPTIKGGPIESYFKKGTQEEWHVMCPHCGEYSFIRFEDIRFDVEEYDAGGGKAKRPKNLRWECPACHGTGREHQMKRQAGKWVERNHEAIKEGIRSFRLSAFMSPWSSWQDISQNFLDAGKDPERLKVFYNTMLGASWEVRDTSGDSERLYDRREYYDAEVPDGAVLLTMGVDTQDNRLEYEVVGWSEDGESWGISRGVIPGRPDEKQVWHELDSLLDRQWRRKNGKGMRVLATFVDSGGHYTLDVYNECAARASKRVWAIKGEAGESKEYVRLMRQSMKGGKEAIRFLIAVDGGKEAILYETTIEEPGPRYMHFPAEPKAGYTLEYFRGLMSEKMVVHTRGGRNYIAWEKVYERNEPLDCRNYAQAAYRFFNWDFDRLTRENAQEPGERTTVRREPTQKQKKSKYMVSGGIVV